MGVYYSTSIFYGVELDVDRQFYFNELEAGVPHSEVSVEMVGDWMCGDPVPVAYIRSSYQDFGSQGSADFGLFPLTSLSLDTEAADKALAEALKDIPTKGEPGWCVGNSVS